jgi:hypothetical protein
MFPLKLATSVTLKAIGFKVAVFVDVVLGVALTEFVI